MAGPGGRGHGHHRNQLSQVQRASLRPPDRSTVASQTLRLNTFNYTMDYAQAGASPTCSTACASRTASRRRQPRACATRLSASTGATPRYVPRLIRRSARQLTIHTYNRLIDPPNHQSQTYARQVIIQREHENRLFAQLSALGFAPLYLGRFSNGRVEGYLEARVRGLNLNGVRASKRGMYYPCTHHPQPNTHTAADSRGDGAGGPGADRHRGAHRAGARADARHARSGPGEEWK